jgi:hypothetical protein
MKFLWIVLSTVLIVAQTGCETFGKKPTKGEIAVRKVNLDQLKLGDNEKKMLRLFPQARLQPFGRPDRRVFEIEKPNPYISLAVAYFMDDRLIKLELRYFNGPGAHTLTSAGGWDGLRDYMVNKFGRSRRRRVISIPNTRTSAVSGLFRSSSGWSSTSPFPARKAASVW